MVKRKTAELDVAETAAATSHVVKPKRTKKANANGENNTPKNTKKPAMPKIKVQRSKAKQIKKPTINKRHFLKIRKQLFSDIVDFNFAEESIKCLHSIFDIMECDFKKPLTTTTTIPADIMDIVEDNSILQQHSTEES